ncbi:Mycobacterium numidiamassiliense ORFan [Mycobacterium numidiamassiliense]|uniref:Mycobacterium numidiamassiliense ORFan n=1 Tax=Mycobacterium numidiamassiliense TaxID=1841861 RepID=A0A2U3PE32_9MYCO|nr:Mycobacterium numidiamassiliense ORFan [Mycobacterium numidiamassiliense]
MHVQPLEVHPGSTGMMLPSRNPLVQMIWFGIAPTPSPSRMYCLHTWKLLARARTPINAADWLPTDLCCQEPSKKS